MATPLPMTIAAPIAPPIDGAWATSEETLSVTSPHRGETLACVEIASQEQCEQALCASAAAAPRLAAMAAWERSERLASVAERLRGASEELAQLICQEAGKPIRDARGEASRAAYVFRWAAEEAKRRSGEWIPLDAEPGLGRRAGILRHFPVGPVLAITPFNFPLNLACHKLAPALAAGNPVLLKPSLHTPLSSIRLAEIVLGEDWPDGAVQVLALDAEATAELAHDDRIAAITFTGSDAAGWALKAANPRKRVTLELGGNAAVLIEPDADLELAARRLAFGAFAFSGQVCISTQRILVAREAASEFTERFVSLVEQLVVGDPSDETTDLGPMIDAAAAERVRQWVGEAQALGARVLTGGRCEPPVHWPTVLTDVPRESRCWSEEIFGPVVTLREYDSFEEGLALANATRFGLQCAIFTERHERALAAQSAIRAGAVIVNDAPFFRAVQMPYGGVKDSGTGREGVRFAMRELSEERLLIMPLPDEPGQAADGR